MTTTPELGLDRLPADVGGQWLLPHLRDPLEARGPSGRRPHVEQPVGQQSYAIRRMPTPGSRAEWQLTERRARKGLMDDA